MIRLITAAASLAAIAMVPAAQGRDTSAPTGRVTAASRAALREPLRAGFLQSVQVHPYAEGAIYRLFAAPETERLRRFLSAGKAA